MSPIHKKYIKSWCTVAFLLFAGAVFAQQKFDEAYIKVTNERAEKIVNDLGISDAGKQLRVRDIIAQQYRDLSVIHDARDEKLKAVKEGTGSKEEKEKAAKKIEKKSNKAIARLHKSYLKKLNSELTPNQVTGVKDGMTYGVLPKTYRAFQEMLPDLTQAQKDTILAYLTEAREHAMNAGSSKEKHGWFGEYKGKINNYLSAQGYNLKKAGEEWKKRREAQANNK
ncbi:DUF3826 domain-containing protein [Sinomicrobium pectinilyticum]|uniref:DUF3826 domain-containing protein n=1 Tax=Sinomicrobium pectinilyticum TaxID=1084421 RepID=A0A3N0EN49_SINP1|nr:DUF3826 domain-containing protein [Sinomicrobium pectinilyticum]RNL89326.1 DUF3826 domain-containing protein [Sinomicrobium pectinilyticum]